MELKLARTQVARFGLWLLIELYGIETAETASVQAQAKLLIELYGIETQERNSRRNQGYSAFNRTIWN